MTTDLRPPALLAALTISIGFFAGCGSSPAQQGGNDSGQDADTATDSNGDTGTDTGTNVDDGAVTDTGLGAVAITLSESSFTMDTPDLHHGLTATITGTTTTTVAWSSSNSYIATVSAGGVGTSVSGGQVTITATSMADASKTAACTVMVAEPNRAKAASSVDARTITSGPIRIITAGDSLTRTYSTNAADQSGWGQVLGEFLTS